MIKINQLGLWGSILFLVMTSCTQTIKKSTLPIYLKETKPVSEIAEIYNKFERFKYQIIGHFSNQEQLEAGTTSDPLQEFIVVPILQDRANEFWVYLEFFSPNLLDQPLDQRIEQYVKVSRDTFRMEVYYLKEPQKYINAWKKDKFPPLSTQDDLIRDEACDLLIVQKEEEEGAFKTLPPAEITCEMLTSTTKARYVDLEFELNDSQYLMWFKFYDEYKNHLKKTDKSGLLFKRLDPKKTGYKDLSRIK